MSSLTARPIWFGLRRFTLP